MATKMDLNKSLALRASPCLIHGKEADADTGENSSESHYLAGLEVPTLLIWENWQCFTLNCVWFLIPLPPPFQGCLCVLLLWLQALQCCNRSFSPALSPLPITTGWCLTTNPENLHGQLHFHTSLNEELIQTTTTELEEVKWVLGLFHLLFCFSLLLPRIIGETLGMHNMQFCGFCGPPPLQLLICCV